MFNFALIALLFTQKYKWNRNHSKCRYLVRDGLELHPGAVAISASGSSILFEPVGSIMTWAFSKKNNKQFRVIDDKNMSFSCTQNRKYTKFHCIPKQIHKNMDPKLPNFYKEMYSGGTVGNTCLPLVYIYLKVWVPYFLWVYKGRILVKLTVQYNTIQ